MTALIGGFLLYKTDKPVKEPTEETTNKIQDYTSLADNDSEENAEENTDTENDMDTESDNDKKSIVEKKVKEAKKNLSDVDDDDYEKSIDFYDLYKKEYSEKQIDNVIKQTYEVIFLLSSTSSSEEFVQKKWEELATDELLDKLMSGQKDSISFRGYKNVEVVPVESDYNGIAVGVFISMGSDVALFEFDFEVSKDKALLDDFNVLWSS